MSGGWDTGILPRVHPTVVHMLADAVARAAGAAALVCEERQLSYAEYLRRVAGFARELRQMGAGGSRVALVCGNSLDMPVATFAVNAAGAQAVPVNPTYTVRELSHILDDAQCQVVICDAAVAATVEPLLESAKVPHAVKIGGAQSRGLDAWRADATLTLPDPLPSPEDLATLQYTGGTAGLPKGVNITHGQMSVNISQREVALPSRADDEIILCMMPLFHVEGRGSHQLHPKGKLIKVDWIPTEEEVAPHTTVSRPPG